MNLTKGKSNYICIATPGPHEKEVEERRVTQIMRPTGLLDPKLQFSKIKLII